MREQQNGAYDVEALLRRGTSVQFPPTGWSMYPLIVNGRDQVIVEPVDPARVRRGDVVLYRRPGGILVLHRVWKRTDEGFCMVGDNQSEIEGPLPPEVVCGVMTAVIRNGRTIRASDPLYRLLAGIWLALRPMRGPISRAVAAIKRAAQKK